MGVPLPDATRTKLEYLSSPESIWDAEVVLIDEISRTRPELQNKLFPIIYDRRVQGRPLLRLAYRWAAMNPPPTDEELDEGDALYLGSEPLDAALADRFPYIMSVPDWDDLTPADQKKVLADQFAGRHEFPVAIRELVAEARTRYEELVPELTPRLTPYIVTLVPKLHAAKYEISTRRATMLMRCAIVVHAAREVLSKLTAGDAPELYDSARLALLNTLPDRARRRLNAAELTAICKSAWELSMCDEADPLVQFMKINDPVLRLRKMVAEEVPSVAQTLLPYCRGGLCTVHVFSTVVHPASARDLAARKFSSTGGTDIDCVLKHVLELPPRKRPRAAVVVTDGFTGKPDAALAERFHAAGMRLFVGLVKSDSDYSQESDLSSIADKFIKLF